MGKKSRSKNGIRIRDEHSGSYFRELRHYFWVKILKLCDADPDPEVFLTLDSGSGMGKNSDPGSGVNIYIGSATLVYLLVRGNDSFLGIFLGIV
jgi:hypothetical protein